MAQSLAALLVLLLITAGITWAGEVHRAFPQPLKDTFDPALLELMEIVDKQRIPELPDGVPICGTSEGRFLDKDQPDKAPQKKGPCHDAQDRNDTSPFLYGDTYVIHIYVDDGASGAWIKSSLNPFDYTRDTEAARVRTATEWIESKAPSDLSVDFNTSNTNTYSYYEATISGTISYGCDHDLLLVDVPQDIGFWDADNDGDVLDDMLEFLRTQDGGGWENVIAVFHLNHESRSFALSDKTPNEGGSKSATACFTQNKIWEVTVPIMARTYAHEMLHLFGASDEYYDKEKGGCGGGNCDEDYENKWIEPVYKNANCALCIGDLSCIMRTTA